MQVTKFKKAPLAAGIALAVGVPFPYGFAVAEEANAAGQVEEQIVYGIRESLKKSADIKRDSAGVVDAISAEDIGDFPDSNLAESLQRITGVAIDRERGEGKEVTVRGFGPPFNLVTLNGRQMPTASGLNRSFDFGNLASEGIASVRVYKSGKADVPTGGIGSTIDIRTTRPLEAPGYKGTISASVMNDQSTTLGDDYTPEVSALFSNTFADDTVGVSLSLIRQDRNNGANTASVAGWRSFAGNVDNDWGNPNSPTEWGGIPNDPNTQVNRTTSADEVYSVPQNTGYELAEWKRTRTNGQLTLQWRPLETVTGTLDYTYSEVELERTYSNYSAWYNFGGQESQWTDGPNASPLVYAENNGGGGDFAMGAGSDATVAENKSVGFNLVWDVSEQLVLELDHHNSMATKQPGSVFGDSSQLAISAFSRDKTTTYFGGQLPILSLDLSNPLSPDDMIVTGSVFTNNFSKMGIEQTELSGTFEFDADRFVDSIDFGVQVTEVNNRSAGSVVQRDAWGGVTQANAIADLLTPASAAGAFDNFSGGDDSRLTTDYYTFSMPAMIARTESLMASGAASTFYANDMGDCGTGLCASSTYSSDRRTQEESTAAYLQADASTELMGKPVGLRFGLRWEETTIKSQALAPNYSGINWVGGNEFSAVQDGTDFTELTGSYNYLLPNLDLRMDVTDEMVLRASFSKTLTRPNYGDIQGGITIAQLLRIDGGDGSRGNPELLPFESTNYDLSFEYYYGEGSYLSAGYFRKDVDNFIGSASVTEPLFNLNHPGQGAYVAEAQAALGVTATSGELRDWILANKDGSPGVNAAANLISGVAGDPIAEFDLTVPVNIAEASMKGWELNLQHNFGATGFGFIVNATLVEADVGYDNMGLGQQFVLGGLGDTANFIGFYDKDGFQARLAYNWRDDFLAGTGQANVGAIPPTYVADYAQWDMSVSYEINDNAKVFLDIINLTDETRHVYGRTELQTLFASQDGTRYNLGIRYTF